MNEAKPYGSNVGVLPPVIEDWDFRSRINQELGDYRDNIVKKERRERIATAVLAGWVAAPNVYSGDVERHIKTALEYTDKLIAALDR